MFKTTKVFVAVSLLLGFAYAQDIFLSPEEINPAAHGLISFLNDEVP